MEDPRKLLFMAIVFINIYILEHKTEKFKNIYSLIYLKHLFINLFKTITC